MHVVDLARIKSFFTILIDHIHFFIVVYTLASNDGFASTIRIYIQLIEPSSRIK
jgi:hypothetical protein